MIVSARIADAFRLSKLDRLKRSSDTFTKPRGRERQAVSALSGKLPGGRSFCNDSEKDSRKSHEHVKPVRLHQLVCRNLDLEISDLKSQLLLLSDVELRIRGAILCFRVRVERNEEH